MDPFAAGFIASLKEQGFTIIEQIQKPWGVSIRLDDQQLSKFLKLYYQGVNLPEFDSSVSLSPKFLLVSPGQRFSWQVHDRRWEIWRIVKGPLGIFTSQTDEHPETLQTFQEGESVTIHDAIRHRAVGLDTWGVIAEIWVHKNPDHPSDEDDIRRISDDFGR